MKRQLKAASKRSVSRKASATKRKRSRERAGGSLDSEAELNKRASKQALKSKALDRAVRVLERARLETSNSTTEALRRLDAAMTKEFGKNYDTKLRPVGILLSEKVKLPKASKIPPVTGTGTLHCKTLFPPTGCSADVDF